MLADRVDFLGLLDDDAMLAEIAAASVVLVPSRIIEGFALVALEAAHLGRPVVATDVGGLSETVIDGVTGLLVPPEDADALATAVDRLLAAPDRAATMGTAARLAAARFDVDECAGAYTDAYRELGAEPVLRSAATVSGASNG